MATKPGSTGNGRKNLFTANASENSGRLRHCTTKLSQHPRGFEDEQEETTL